MPKLHDHIVGLSDKVSPVKVIDPKIDSILNEMEVIPQITVSASQWLTDAWIRLGRPESPFTENGEKLLNVIIATWEELYPADSKQWYEDRKEYQNNELGITEQVHKGTGRSLASYPFPVFQMMKKVFPSLNFSDRKVNIKLVRRFPVFKFAKKI